MDWAGSSAVDFVAVKAPKEPQVSTGTGSYAVNNSINSTYFLQISTGLNNSFNLLWEQRAGGSNPSAPTTINLLKLNRLSRILSLINSLGTFYTVPCRL